MKNKKIYILIALLCCLFLAGITTGYFLFNQGGMMEDDLAIDYEAKTSQSISAASDRIIIPGYGTLQMPANSDILKVALANPKDNPCYFKFTLRLDETGEVLYESKLVAPGKAIVEEKLNVTMQEGTHPITIQIQTYALDDRNQEMNGSEIKTEIVTFTSND